MLKGINIFVIFIGAHLLNQEQAFFINNDYILPVATSYSIKKTKNKKSRKSIKKLCNKAKQKIILLEAKARKKSTPKVQRCKRAYSALRYQSCHLKKYNQRKIEAAKNCNK